MNLRQMSYFIAVIENASMTRAAEVCHVAQTALSMQIRQLEDELGVALLVRHSRGVEPTPAGQILYIRAQEVLKLTQDIRQVVRAADAGESEAVRIGVTPALLMFLGDELAVSIREKLPNVFPTIIEDMSHVLTDALAQGGLDFILCYDVPAQATRSRVALLQDDLVLVTAPSNARAQPIEFTQAMQASLAMPETGDSIRELVARVAQGMGLTLRVDFEVRSITVMKQLVSRGAACCILPFFAVIGEVESGELDARPIVSPPLRRTLYLAQSARSGPFKCQEGLANVINGALRPLIEKLGPLAHPVLSAPRA